MYLKTPEELKGAGISMLPATLGEAVEAFAADPLSKEVFGDKMFQAWIDYKREEWMSYTNHVSDWEKERYLKLF
jgi:glutamine synthetase